MTEPPPDAAANETAIEMAQREIVKLQHDIDLANAQLDQIRTMIHEAGTR